jgi:hypothetical protein
MSFPLWLGRMMSMTNGWPKSAKIVMWTLACLLVASLTLYEASSLRAWYLARLLSRENPSLLLLPIPLPDSRLAVLDGARIERLGISMQSPWKVIEKEKHVNFIGATTLFFAQGRVLIFDPSGKLEQNEGIRTHGIKRQWITRLFGRDTFKSDYDLMAAELQSRPAQVKWWGTHTSNIRNMSLLTLKYYDVGIRPTVIYSMHFGALWGFQFGDPAAAPYRVKLTLFDQNDRRYELLLSGRDREHPSLSQAQVNAFVASIRPLPLTTGLPVE